MINQNRNRTEEQTTDTLYIAYPCEPTSETRGRSDTKQNGCSTWSLRVSQRTLIGRRWKMQMKCKHCGNRPRIGPEKAHVFSSRAKAIRFVDERNASISLRLQAEDEGFHYTDQQWNEMMTKKVLDEYLELPKPLPLGDDE